MEANVRTLYLKVRAPLPLDHSHTKPQMDLNHAQGSEGPNPLIRIWLLTDTIGGGGVEAATETQSPKLVGSTPSFGTPLHLDLVRVSTSWSVPARQTAD